MAMRKETTGVPAKVVRMGCFSFLAVASLVFLTRKVCSQNQKQESDTREGDGSLISRVRAYFCADGW